MEGARLVAALGGIEPRSWTDIPTSILRAELARRQNEPTAKPTCGSGSNRGSYNTPLHVAALVLILVLSTVACSFPIIVRQYPKLPVPHHFLFLSRHFGTGVLIATAFVHLLPTAFISLTNPCLSHFWNKGYPAMAGFIAMISVLVVVAIEQFFATRGAGHVHESEYGALRPEETATRLRNGSASRPGHTRQESMRHFRQMKIGDEEGSARPISLHDLHDSSENLVAGTSAAQPLSPFTDVPRDSPQKSAADSDADSDFDLDELDPTAVDDADLLHPNGHTHASSRRPSKPYAHPPESPSHQRADPNHLPRPASLQEQRKLLLQCLLLEAGILFHSVFIGMALSVATGTSFIVLLVAISFHQTFEGLALGSRISFIPSLPPSSPKPWLMALAYGLTTPIGQAIGLLVHNMYDPQSQTGLLMVGVMNAISSGLLLFAGLVELLAEDFLSDKSYEGLVGARRLQAYGCVVGGAGLMAFVGAFA